ncbi:MAG: OmpL47-type beta-barrel domain-containing protein [Ectobacillus sp.]
MKKVLSILAAAAVALPSFLPSAQAEEALATAEDLFISEYVEGSSYNKAIEIFNGTGQTVDLSQYTLELYSNGAAAPSSKVDLTGSLANGNVFVLAHTSANDAIKAAADLLNGSVTNFNGDDAIVLKKNGIAIDVFGQVGSDPGTSWGTGDYATADHTLIRKETVRAGDKIADDSFDPSVEWISSAKDSAADLGKHTFKGMAQETDPEIGALSIAEAKAKQGQTVTIEGVVTADNSAVGGGKLSTYIQDETAGINVFEMDPAAFPELKEGQAVKVTGSITSYKGLTEIKPAAGGIEVLAENTALPEPKPMAIADLQDAMKAEQNEGQLVKVTGFIENIPASPAGGGYNINFIDENFQSTTLRVMEGALDVSGLQAGKWYEVTAILSQYNGYQLLPRKAADVKLANPQPEAPKSAGEFSSTIAAVVDGDTVHLSTPVLGATKVRFVNIDTPETYHKVVTEADANQKEHGEAAKAYLNTLLQAGDEVKVIVGAEAKDSYGRLLAQIVRKSDNLNTNLEMVRQGYASTYFIWPIGDPAVYETFQAAVKEAKDNGRGIWNPANPLLELPFAFRAREQGKGFTRYVADYKTKTYVEPEKWAEVPVENRIFFASEQEAEQNGYVKAAELPKDTQAPEAQAMLSKADFRDGSYLHEAVFTIGATDEESGVSYIEYSVDSGAAWTRYEGQVTVQGDGAHTVSYRAVDNAGNVSEAKSVSVTIKAATIENTIEMVKAAKATKGMKQSIIVQLEAAKRSFEKERKEQAAYDSLERLQERVKRYPNQLISKDDKKEIANMLHYIVTHQTESK